MIKKYYFGYKLDDLTHYTFKENLYSYINKKYGNVCWLDFKEKFIKEFEEKDIFQYGGLLYELFNNEDIEMSKYFICPPNYKIKKIKKISKHNIIFDFGIVISAFEYKVTVDNPIANNPCQNYIFLMYEIFYPDNEFCIEKIGNYFERTCNEKVISNINLKPKFDKKYIRFDFLNLDLNYETEKEKLIPYLSNFFEITVFNKFKRINYYQEMDKIKKEEELVSRYKIKKL